MAAQAALIADTIIGMKRALRREDDYTGPDDPITQPTNRGNKLRGSAKYVREGVLGFIHPEELYKQKIEHAGYTRYILQRNPVRYDSEGDELDDDDEDSEADAAAAEENPFAEIALEDLLCPLKHPSELPSHPSLSHAYTSTALETMTQSIEAKLRQERALLWRARNLHRQFLGDSCWMPCGMVEALDDRSIFPPRHIGSAHGSPRSRTGRSRAASPAIVVSSTGENDPQPSMPEGIGMRQLSTAQDESNKQDIEIVDTSGSEIEVVRDGKTEAQKELKSEEADGQYVDTTENVSDGQTNCIHVEERKAALKAGEEFDINEKARSPGRTELLQKETASTDRIKDAETNETRTDNRSETGHSQEPPRRMTTRAQANAAISLHEADSTNQSPSPSTETVSTIQTPHPLFLIPDSVRPDANFGLPPHEAEETRRLLWSYIQKQEETVRGFEHMLNCLLKACRMKDEILEWCKADGHVGEMSDGEDWYDREKWGLAEGEDLKKGADEEDMDAAVDESRATGKRRGRRA